MSNEKTEVQEIINFEEGREVFKVMQRTDRGLIGSKGRFNDRTAAEDFVKVLNSTYSDRVYEVVPEKVSF